MNKNEFQQYVTKELGGIARYSGKTKTFHVYGKRDLGTVHIHTFGAIVHKDEPVPLSNRRQNKQRQALKRRARYLSTLKATSVVV